MSNSPTAEYNTDKFRHHTAMAVDQIDAAIFNGDEFLSIQARVMLRRFIVRWQKKLSELTDADMRAHGLPVEGEDADGQDDDSTFA